MGDGPRWQFGLGRENGLALWGMVFLEGSFAAYLPVWTLFMEELGAPITLIGLLLGFSGIIRFIVLLPTASIARRIGAKQLLILSRFVAMVGIGAAALAPGWPYLLPAMIGIAAGTMAFPIVMAHVAANAGEQRMRAFALVVTIGPAIAFLAAPLASSGLIAFFGLRSAFVLSAVLSLISILVFMRIQSTDNPVEDEREATSSASYRSVLALPQARTVLLLKFLTVFTVGLGAQLIPNYLRQVGGYSDDLIALLTSLSAVGSIVFGFLIVRNQRFASVPLRGAAIAVASVSIGYLLFLQPTVMPVIVVGFILRGGLFSSLSLFATALGDVTPNRNHHHVFTLGEILIVAGFTLAPVVAGLLYSLWPALPLVVTAGLAIPLVAFLARTRLIPIAEPVPAPAISS